MAVLVLLRHGESAWNAQDRFAGWTDVALSERGRQQARRAGALLAAGVAGDDADNRQAPRTAVTRRELAHQANRA